jgi:hypothetical protein
MRDALVDWSLRPLVQALMSMRGIQLIAAMTLVAEPQDFMRFECFDVPPVLAAVPVLMNASKDQV